MLDSYKHKKRNTFFLQDNAHLSYCLFVKFSHDALRSNLLIIILAKYTTTRK